MLSVDFTKRSYEGSLAVQLACSAGDMFTLTIGDVEVPIKVEKGEVVLVAISQSNGSANRNRICLVPVADTVLKTITGTCEMRAESLESGYVYATRILPVS